MLHRQLRRYTLYLGSTTLTSRANSCEVLLISLKRIHSGGEPKCARTEDGWMATTVLSRTVRYRPSGDSFAALAKKPATKHLLRRFGNNSQGQVPRNSCSEATYIFLCHWSKRLGSYMQLDINFAAYPCLRCSPNISRKKISSRHHLRKALMSSPQLDNSRSGGANFLQYLDRAERERGAEAKEYTSPKHLVSSSMQTLHQVYEGLKFESGNNIWCQQIPPLARLCFARLSHS